MQDFKDIICSVGFPIAGCIGMFYIYTKTLTLINVSLARLEQKLDDLIMVMKQK